MENPKQAKVNKIQLYNVRFNGKHYTGANGLYCGADVDLASISKLQSFFLAAMSAHASRISNFMPLNPEHGLHCTIVYSEKASSLPASNVRDYATQLNTDTGIFAATVKSFEYWPDRKGRGGYLVAVLDCKTAATLSNKVQKDMKVDHSFKGDYQAHVTLTDKRDGQAYAPYVPFLNERLRTFAGGGIPIEFNFVGIRDIQ